MDLFGSRLENNGLDEDTSQEFGVPPQALHVELESDPAGGIRSRKQVKLNDTVAEPDEVDSPACRGKAWRSDCSIVKPAVDCNNHVHGLARGETVKPRPLLGITFDEGGPA